MRNVIALFCVISTLLGFAVNLDNNFVLNDYQKVVLVSEKEIQDCDFVQNGRDFYCTFVDESWKLYQKDSMGIIFYFENFNLSSFSKSCDFIFKCEDIDGKEIYEGYYAGFKDSCFVDGKKVNFQLAIDNNLAILGFPMIITGF